MINPALLTQAAQAAIAAENATQLPRQITLAQWALESGWGEHQPGLNCFGIKSYDGDYGMQELVTTEFLNGVAKRLPQWFATFKTLGDCFAKHASLITGSNRYSMAWGNFLANKDIGQLIDHMAPIYATDPFYATKLNQIIAMPEVVAVLNQTQMTT